MKKIAVLFASYNGKQWIKEQINSILNQKGVDVTIFISDDLSTDGTREYIQDEYSNIKNIIILNDAGKFGGAAKNFYRLIRDVNFTGFDYISLADQDDVWYEDKLIRAISTIEEKQIDGYSSNILAFWEDGKEMVLDKAQNQTKYDYLFEAAGPGCTYVLKSNLANKIQSFIKLKWDDVNQIDLHDWLIYAYSRENKYQWYIDKVPTMRYRQHSSNQVGANSGVNAKIKRIKLVLSSWYRDETKKIINILGLGTKYSFSKYIQNKTYLNNLFLLKYVFEFRRRFKEKIFLAILLVVGIY